jgi:SAM-dependent methyltransferase
VLLILRVSTGISVCEVTSNERWLAAVWPFVQSHLPPAPASVLEIGCGPLGGFVPALLAGGYDAVGVDPEAPQGPEYDRVEFEQYDPPRPLDAVVACTSLHHVTDLDAALRRVAEFIVPDGRLVVVEWARERFDEDTARWCFARLPELEHAAAQHDHHAAGHDHHAAGHDHGAEGGWLHRRRDEWESSGQPWDAVVQAWAEQERMHTGERVLTGLDALFERESLVRGPYFFADLAEVSEADEQAAIDAGQIRATGIRYTGRPRKR